MKKSILPEWFMEKAYDDHWGITQQKKDYREQIERHSRAAKRKNITPRRRKADLCMLRIAKKRLKEFEPEWFSVEDAEGFFKIILEKYELIDKEKVLRPDPKDIGKKHFLCNRCDMKWWTKKKPKKCSKCGSKEIEQYFRV